MSDDSYWDDVDEHARRAPVPEPRRLGRARGSVLAAMMLGLQDVLEPQRAEEAAVVVPARPTQPRGVRVELDPLDPSQSIAVVPVTPPS